MSRRAPRSHGTYVDPASGRRRRLPLVPPLDHEQRLWGQDLAVVGVDEVGRGAWAGPVTCGAVMLDPGARINNLRDSKVLTFEQRARLDLRIRSRARAVGVGHASSEEIDRWGMTRALRTAALRAVDDVGAVVDMILLDGRFDFLSEHPAPVTTIVKGDARSASIAAASIVAKVARDALLVAYDEVHPAYGFASNKGYPAPDHVAALGELGPCPWHRHSWQPIITRTTPRLFEEPG